MAALVLTALSISPVLKDADQSKGQKLFQNYAIHGVFVFSLIQHARSSFAIYLPVNTRGALRMRWIFIIRAAIWLTSAWSVHFQNNVIYGVFFIIFQLKMGVLPFPQHRTPAPKWHSTQAQQLHRFILILQRTPTILSFSSMAHPHHLTRKSERIFSDTRTHAKERLEDCRHRNRSYFIENKFGWKLFTSMTCFLV